MEPIFVDEREVIVRSGRGGDGRVAWRREKRVPRGGPAGGDGGHGGSVVLVADPQLTTFADMEDVRIARAEDGEPGGPDKCHGARGADRELSVPPGTVVFDAASAELLVDLARPGQRWTAARGGRGGRGNARFANATRQRPTFAESGRPARERRLRLELRLLADVGLVGLPNAGKSTFLARISSARPRVAGYPFTTLHPHLGVVELRDFRRFVVADLPGLIEGAHAGQGLGHRFLRHVERTRLLLHLVEGEPADGSDPVENYRLVRAELEAYGRGLATRPELVVLTKVDALDRDRRSVTLSRIAAVADREVHPISAVSGEGVRDLLGAVARELAQALSASARDTGAESSETQDTEPSAGP